MYRMKRFRLLLVLAIIALVALYQSSRLRSWDRFGGSTLKDFSSIHVPAADGRVKTPPAAADSPSRGRPPTTTTATTTTTTAGGGSDSANAGPFDFDAEFAGDRLAAAAAASSAAAAALKSAQPAVDSDPNVITGDELLAQKPQADEFFYQQDTSRLEAKPLGGDKPKPQWQRPKEHFPVSEVRQLPAGKAQQLPQIQFRFAPESLEVRNDRVRKQTAVREAFKHAWAGYKEYAFGHDELKPLSNKSADPFNGWGATLVDALDTMWIMDLKDEFKEAVDEVAKIDFTTSPRKDIPLFETTIRYLGGLLAAYDISGHQYEVLLEKAVELAEVLMGAFDTPNRMPMTFYRWAPSYSSQPHRATSHVVMAELGSLAVEFTRLAQLTKEPKYYDAIARITDALELFQTNTTSPGLWPIKLDASGCQKLQVEKVLDTSNLQSPPTSGRSTKGQDSTGRSSLNKRATTGRIGPEISDKGSSGSDKLKGSSGSDKGKGLPPAPDEEPAIPPGTLDTTPDLDRDPEKDYDYYDYFKEFDNDDDIEYDAERFNVDCDPQALALEPHAKSQIYSLGAQADSTYEYLPKMHALLGGLNAQYKAMYETAMKVVRSELLFRPMTKDEADILFIAKKKVTPKAKTAAEREKLVWEGSHLACFAGGMVALASKIFEIPSDLKLAAKLTNGCVWAYDSTPVGIMPELFELVPCESTKSCTWNATRWHEYLDPRLEDRVIAVEEYNKKQKLLFEVTKSNKDNDNARRNDVWKRDDGDNDDNKEDIKDDNKDENKDENKDDNNAAADTTSTTTTTSSSTTSSSTSTSTSTETSNADDASDGDYDDDDESAEEPGIFHPKTALSHEKYVAARIAEERLPPGYAGIKSPEYQLRPEAIESVFIMYRLTGDPSWRATGWTMFSAAERATRTPVGHATLLDVTSGLGELKDTMESFWLAETLKYYYLLFSEESLVSLDEWVFNTEAHPLALPREGSTLL